MQFQLCVYLLAMRYWQEGGVQVQSLLIGYRKHLGNIAVTPPEGSYHRQHAIDEVLNSRRLYSVHTTLPPSFRQSSKEAS